MRVETKRKHKNIMKCATKINFRYGAQKEQ